MSILFRTLSKFVINKTLLLLFCSFSVAFAQKFELGGGAGLTHYKGELYPTFKVFNTNPGANILIRYNHNNALSLKLGAMIGIFGANETRAGTSLGEERKLRFNHILGEWSGQVEYNFLNFRSTSGPSSDWSPYLFGGYGGYHKLVQKFYDVEGNLLKKNTMSPSFCIPFGVGFKKTWKNQWNFGVEFGARMLLGKEDADNFDGLGRTRDNGVWTDYYIPSTFPHQMSSTITYQPDKYFYTNFYISYSFYRVYCPPAK